jgi:hypothetical protein
MIFIELVIAVMGVWLEPFSFEKRLDGDSDVSGKVPKDEISLWFFVSIDGDQAEKTRKVGDLRKNIFQTSIEKVEGLN